jgi:hypothetical protein
MNLQLRKSETPPTVEGSRELVGRQEDKHLRLKDFKFTAAETFSCLKVSRISNINLLRSRDTYSRRQKRIKLGSRGNLNKEEVLSGPNVHIYS